MKLKYLSFVQVVNKEITASLFNNMNEHTQTTLCTFAIMQENGKPIARK